MARGLLCIIHGVQHFIILEVNRGNVQKLTADIEHQAQEFHVTIPPSTTSNAEGKV